MDLPFFAPINEFCWQEVGLLLLYPESFCLVHENMWETENLCLVPENMWEILSNFSQGRQKGNLGKKDGHRFNILKGLELEF